MKVLIDIPEHHYREVLSRTTHNLKVDRLDRYIANGTPLPRGFGKLKDVDKIYNEIDALNRGENRGRYTAALTIINIADTIIEADNEKDY